MHISKLVSNRKTQTRATMTSMPWLPTRDRTTASTAAHRARRLRPFGWPVAIATHRHISAFPRFSGVQG